MLVSLPLPHQAPSTLPLRARGALGPLAPAAQVRTFLVQHEPDLYARAVHCVVRTGLGHGDRAHELARDLYQELCVAALRTAEHYVPERAPLFHWLTGIL